MEQEKNEIEEANFNPHDVDEMYDDILRGVEFHNISKATERVGRAIQYSFQIALLLILLSVCYVIYLKHSFGVALMFFTVPLILNKSKFKSHAFVWRFLSYFILALNTAYGLFLSFTSNPKIYVILLTAAFSALAILILYAILIVLIFKQDKLVGRVK